jgi:putative ABC transport system substrate-binding protein
MRRRDFIVGLGVAALPNSAGAQQGGPARRIGVIMHLAADDPLLQSGIAGFLQGLQELGWVVGRNIRIDYPGVQARTPMCSKNTRANC